MLKVVGVAGFLLAACAAQASALNYTVDPRQPIETTPVARTIERERLLTSMHLELPRFRIHNEDQTFLDQVTLRSLPPGSLVLRYEGIERVVVSKAQGRLRKLWRSSVIDQWEAGILDDDAFEQAQLDMGNALADQKAGGRWWQRDWTASLMPEDGGAPAEPYVQQIGSKIEVLRLGPLSVTNDCRIRLVNRLVSMRLEPTADSPLRKADPTPKAPRVIPGRVQRLPQVKETEDVLPEDGRVRWWNVRLQPAASIGFNDDPLRVVREVSVRATVEFFVGADRTKCVEVRAVVSYRPTDNVGTVGITAALLTW